jgi:hypothetical protein
MMEPKNHDENRKGSNENKVPDDTEGMKTQPVSGQSSVVLRSSRLPMRCVRGLGFGGHAAPKSFGALREKQKG